MMRIFTARWDWRHCGHKGLLTAPWVPGVCRYELPDDDIISVVVKRFRPHALDGAEGAGYLRAVIRCSRCSSSAQMLWTSL